MIGDANVTPGIPTADAVDTASPVHPTPSATSHSRRQSWIMPTMTQSQVDHVGRIALQIGSQTGAVITRTARYTGRMIRQLVRSAAAVPAAVRVLTVVTTLMLLGITGAVTQHNTLGLTCIVVVVPLSSVILGALGHRWYAGLSAQRSGAAELQTGEPAISDPQRSLEYVDKKLAVAFGAFGAERHQHAMVALFQAKTAIELTLGTEQDADNPIDALLSAEDHAARPRIRAGSASKITLRESNSLAAS